jgi:hypothetical protein
MPVAGLVVDNLELVAQFTGKPTGDTTTSPSPRPTRSGTSRSI